MESLTGLNGHQRSRVHFSVHETTPSATLSWNAAVFRSPSADHGYAPGYLPAGDGRVVTWRKARLIKFAVKRVADATCGHGNSRAARPLSRQYRQHRLLL